MKKNENSKKLVLKKIKISELNHLNTIIGGIDPLNQGGGASGVTGGQICISEWFSCPTNC